MTDRSAAYSATWQQLFDVTGSVGRGALTPGAWRGAGGRRLAHSDEAWTNAAAALREVGAELGRVDADFAESHAGLAPATTGLSAAGVLAALRTSWQERFGAAVVECGTLAEALVAVAEAQGAREAAVRTSFAGPGAGAGGASGRGGAGGGGGSGAAALGVAIAGAGARTGTSGGAS
ncbi:hypothetical protein [Streptomyces sp. NBC_01497]|uniref:hypothetical protein n=1 Tax=Streptomyces sp. NBC_01497 TaxID=2903885 RepID=UPI002E37AEA4|nr:hypothetical protein [Streptomyces sp. NBC_01497]